MTLVSPVVGRQFCRGQRQKIKGKEKGPVTGDEWRLIFTKIKSPASLDRFDRRGDLTASRRKVRPRRTVEIGELPELA
jgi:hypothetical protein